MSIRLIVGPEVGEKDAEQDASQRLAFLIREAPGVHGIARQRQKVRRLQLNDLH